MGQWRELLLTGLGLQPADHVLVGLFQDREVLETERPEVIVGRRCGGFARQRRGDGGGWNFGAGPNWKTWAI